MHATAGNLQDAFVVDADRERAETFSNVLSKAKLSTVAITENIDLSRDLWEDSKKNGRLNEITRCKHKPKKAILSSEIGGFKPPAKMNLNKVVIIKRCIDSQCHEKDDEHVSGLQLRFYALLGEQ